MKKLLFFPLFIASTACFAQSNSKPVMGSIALDSVGASKKNTTTTSQPEMKSFGQSEPQKNNSKTSGDTQPPKMDQMQKAPDPKKNSQPK